MIRGRSRTALRTTRARRTRKPTQCLTPRQTQIMKLVAKGRTSRQIADKLRISVRTVEVHRFNLMHRLNVRNVAQLLRLSLQLGLLPRSFGR